MVIIRNIVEFIFSIALFINALLFVSQSIKIMKEKSAKGVSLVTFLGLLLIQLTIVLHGIIVHDYLLVWGYLISMATTGSVVVLVLFYRKRKSKFDADELDLEEVIAQFPCYVYWKNRNCAFVGSNINNKKDFGIDSPNNYKGTTDYDIFPKQEADKLRMIDEEIIRTGKSKVIEERSTKSNGEKALYLSHKKPLKNKKVILLV